MTQTTTQAEPQFVLHESLTETELNAIVSTVEADSIRLRQIIARNDALTEMARHRLIGIQLAEAERE
jgi:hypothetical protein